MATLLQPGRISPLRQVPANIPRPEYVGRARPKTGEPNIKDAGTIERMRAAGKLAARALAEVGRHVEPGVTTDELDRIGHEFLCDHSAYPSTLGYRGFPKSLCTSLNEVICHGILDVRLTGLRAGPAHVLRPRDVRGHLPQWGNPAGLEQSRHVLRV